MRKQRGSKEEAVRKQRGSREEVERKQRVSSEEAKRKQRGSREEAERKPRGSREKQKQENLICIEHTTLKNGTFVVWQSIYQPNKCCKYFWNFWRDIFMCCQSRVLE